MIFELTQTMRNFREKRTPLCLCLWASTQLQFLNCDWMPNAKSDSIETRMTKMLCLHISAHGMQAQRLAETIKCCRMTADASNDIRDAVGRLMWPIYWLYGSGERLLQRMQQTVGITLKLKSECQKLVTFGSKERKENIRTLTPKRLTTGYLLIGFLNVFSPWKFRLYHGQCSNAARCEDECAFLWKRPLQIRNRLTDQQNRLMKSDRQYKSGSNNQTMTSLQVCDPPGGRNLHAVIIAPKNAYNYRMFRRRPIMSASY